MLPSLDNPILFIIMQLIIYLFYLFILLLFTVFQRHMSRILVSMELRLEEHTKILSNIVLALSQINDSAKNTLSLSPSSNLSSDKLAAEIYSKLPLKNNEEMADLITSQIINDEDTI